MILFIIIYIVLPVNKFIYNSERKSAVVRKKTYYRFKYVKYVINKTRIKKIKYVINKIRKTHYRFKKK